MTLANKLSFLRLFLTPFAVAFIFIDVPYNYYIAIFIYIFSAATDLVDGYVARKYNQVTKLGIFLDPLIDKVFNYSVVMTLLYLQVFPLWVVLLLFTRDLMADGFKNLAVKNQDFISPVYPGKVKTFLVTIAIIIGELSLAAGAGYNIFSISSESFRNASYYCLIFALIIGFVGVTSILEKAWKDMTGKYNI